MNLERAILIAFLGNYLVNNVVAAIASFVPAGDGTQVVSMQYIAFVLLAAITVAILAWWYGARSVKTGAIFGAVGFLTAIASVFVTGVSGVLVQTASFEALVSVLPNFVPFLLSASTLVLFCYWIIPAILIGWWMRPKAATPAAVAVQPKA